MSKNKQEFKVGDLVRVSGHARYLPRRNEDWPRHHIKSGTVCRVLHFASDGCVSVEAPEWPQVVHTAQLKLAKQAMRKRGEYAARR